MTCISTFTVVLIAFLCQSQAFGFNETIDQTSLAATCSSATTVQVFSAILFIDLISAHDPEVVFGLRLPSDIAAEKLYHEKLRIFQEKGFQNAEDISLISANAFLSKDEFSIPFYFLTSGTTVGGFLTERGLLNCDNVIQTATAYFENEYRVFQSLDPAEFESYVRAIIIGFEDLLEDLGYTIEQNEANWKISSESFSRVYSNQVSLAPVWL